MPPKFPLSLGHETAGIIMDRNKSNFKNYTNVVIDPLDISACKNIEKNPLFLSVSSLSASISLVATTFVVMQFKKQAIPWICLTSGVVDTVLHKNLWDQKNPQSIPFKLLKHTSIYLISGLLVRGTISDEQNVNQVACFLQLVAAMLYQLTCYNTGINYRGGAAKVMPGS